MNRVLQQPVSSIMATSNGMRDLAAILRSCGAAVVWFGGGELCRMGVAAAKYGDMGVTLTITWYDNDGFGIWLGSGVEGLSCRSVFAARGVEGGISAGKHPDRCDRLQSDPSYRGLRKADNCSAGLHYLRHISKLYHLQPLILFSICIYVRPRGS